MSIALVAHTTLASTSSGGTSSPIDTTGASLLIVATACLYNNTPSLVDNKGNAWLTAAFQNGTIAHTCSVIFYAWNPVVGASHTFTTGLGTYPASEILAFSGVLASSNPTDQSNSATNPSSLTIQPGSITPSQNGSLIIAHLALDYTSPTPSINSGMTEIDYINFNNGVYFGSDAAYFVQGTAAAINPTWTAVSGAPLELSTTIANFLPAPVLPILSAALVESADTSVVALNSTFRITAALVESADSADIELLAQAIISAPIEEAADVAVIVLLNTGIITAALVESPDTSVIPLVGLATLSAALVESPDTSVIPLKVAITLAIAGTELPDAIYAQLGIILSIILDAGTGDGADTAVIILSNTGSWEDCGQVSDTWTDCTDAATTWASCAPSTPTTWTSCAGVSLTPPDAPNDLLTEDGDDLLTEDGDTLILES